MFFFGWERIIVRKTRLWLLLLLWLCLFWLLSLVSLLLSFLQPNNFFSSACSPVPSAGILGCNFLHLGKTNTGDNGFVGFHKFTQLRHHHCAPFFPRLGVWLWARRSSKLWRLHFATVQVWTRTKIWHVDPWMHPHHEGVPFLSVFSPKIGCILDFWIIWWFSIFFCTLWFWHPTSAIFVPGWFGWSRDLNENAWFLGVFINGGTPIAGWFIKENHWKISMCYSCYRKGFHRVVIC